MRLTSFFHLETDTVFLADQTIMFYPASLQLAFICEFFYWAGDVPIAHIFIAALLFAITHSMDTFLKIVILIV